MVGPLPIMSKALGSSSFTYNKQIKFKNILEIKKEGRMGPFLACRLQADIQQTGKGLRTFVAPLDSRDRELASNLNSASQQLCDIGQIMQPFYSPHLSKRIVTFLLVVTLQDYIYAYSCQYIYSQCLILVIFVTTMHPGFEGVQMRMSLSTVSFVFTARLLRWVFGAQYLLVHSCTHFQVFIETMACWCCHKH